MAAYAALVSLMNNIEQIQSHTRLPIRFDQTQSEDLLEKVNFLIDFLEKYNYRRAGEEMKELESRITGAAYAAEDIIETHVVDKIHDYSRSRNRVNKIMAPIRRILCRMMNETNTTISASQTEKNPYLPDIDKVMENMDFIKEEAMKIKDRNETQVMHPTTPIIGPSMSSVPAGKNTTVGFDDELKRIMEWLLARHSGRQVIPIVGMGGIGKTTLAKTAYEKFKGGKHFDFCAWVTISQDYDFKKIMLGLLSSSSSQSDQDLGQMLYQSLYGRRYLIVLDDMWSVEAWEMVMRFLPDDNNCSRIIVTTRESTVSTFFGSSSLEMSFFDEDQSWNLFCEKVFSAKGCPQELEEVGRNIVRNCKGLPLSIVVIGGLLAKYERTKSYWDDVAQDIKTHMSLEDNGHCMEILSLSYQNLPIHLKPCFLYIGAFLEDEEISASKLIKLWVAEGFLKSESSKGLEELAETYLNDLISRNLILINRRRNNGKVKSCMIHDLMRDLCLKIVKNEKFMYASNMCIRDEITIGSHRRISIHKSSIPQVLSTRKSRSMLQTRTLIFTDDKCPQLQNFRLLRVLNGIKSLFPEIKYSLHDALMLVNLRLIAISTRRPTTIPSSICLSWNLRILILSESSAGVVAPLEIWEMTELRNLEFYWGFYLPDPPQSQQINTQTCDVTMKSLQTLSTINNFRLSDEVVKRIPNIKKLKISYDFAGNELEEMGLEKLGLLKNLESLNLSFEPPTDSDHLSNLSFPNSLKKLTLLWSRLEWKHMTMISSIPHLEVLKLKTRSLKGPKWELDEEEKFPCLKYLQISSCYDLKEWIADDSHFPVLEHLYLEELDKLVEIPSGIGNIPTLRLIDLNRCNKSVGTFAKRILEEQENLGNVGLKVRTYYFAKEDHELESLACDNFIVKRKWGSIGN